jgi:hypothetical protein
VSTIHFFRRANNERATCTMTVLVSIRRPSPLI